MKKGSCLGFASGRRGVSAGQACGGLVADLAIEIGGDLTVPRSRRTLQALAAF